MEDGRPRGANSLNPSASDGGAAPELAITFADTGSAADLDVDGEDESVIEPDVPILHAPGAPESAVPARTTADGMDLELILRDRPDVFQGFFTEFYGPNNDRNSSAWDHRVGGSTPQDYANYWYEKFGKWEGYTQPGKTAHEVIDIEQLLRDRPDVFQGFFYEYYGPNNDRHSSAWVNRVGGETVQDYARYWYDTFGRSEGYTQRPPPVATPGIPEEENPEDQDPLDPLDPSDPPLIDHDPQEPVESPEPDELVDPEVTSVGQALLSLDPLG